MDVNIYYTEVYENILCIRQSMKANPNKPNFKPEGTVKSRLHRILEELRKIME
jgi:hypothetical protein